MRALATRAISVDVDITHDFNDDAAYLDGLPPDFLNPNPGDLEAKIVADTGKYCLQIKNLARIDTTQLPDRYWPVYWLGQRVKVDKAHPFRVALVHREKVATSDAGGFGPALLGLNRWILGRYRYTTNPGTDQLYLRWGRDTILDGQTLNTNLTGVLLTWANGPARMKTCLDYFVSGSNAYYTCKSFNPALAEGPTSFSANTTPNTPPKAESTIPDATSIAVSDIGLIYQNSMSTTKTTLIESIQLVGSLASFNRQRVDRTPLALPRPLAV